VRPADLTGLVYNPRTNRRRQEEKRGWKNKTGGRKRGGEGGRKRKEDGRNR